MHRHADHGKYSVTLRGDATVKLSLTSALEHPRHIEHIILLRDFTDAHASAVAEEVHHDRCSRYLGRSCR